ncbi:M20/M25/M40 family metallo-hydrolase [Virgibacillus sp. YIM 98842]|uniref:M20/M25/M40 family metallo-hydrolase n=1 Tax=Virgibacillus sp. YIM 98842 TaxID=2663533 RepID=UPI0013D9A3CB|nr:M20/M25/M40 family metallo-hydrolase [Virgibacillus sp. YIM 98842]
MYGKRIIYAFMSIIVLLGIVAQGSPAQGQSEQAYGDIALDHISHLADEIGERVAGTSGEEQARDYLYQTFKDLGYDVEVQPFIFGSNGQESSNVIATKEGYLDTEKQIIIGAHYDSVRNVEGVDDNASGVGVMLEAAERAAAADSPYTIHFIAFGAEEVGLRGSHYYVSEMTDIEIESTMAMINLDSLAAGDYMYVHGGIADGSIREMALDISDNLGIDLQINPGLNPNYPEGTTGSWSDHAAFENAGIPIGYFESTNWEIGALDGYTQTEEFGSIWHNPARDNMAFIRENLAERMDSHIKNYAQILTELVHELVAPPSAEGIRTAIEELEAEGEIDNAEAIRVLQIHLIAVGQYENQGEVEKVIRHMGGFQVLLDHQKDQGMISEEAYEQLSHESDLLIQEWER